MHKSTLFIPVNISFLPVCDVFARGISHVRNHVGADVAKGVEGAEVEHDEEGAKDGEDALDRLAADELVFEHVELDRERNVL